jgi:antagonist of KipI
MFTTVQDLGRAGYGLMGMSPSGAADPISLRLGNRLLGNPEGAAALEMTLTGGAFEFPAGAVVALTGADCAQPMWTPIEVAPGGVLNVGPLPQHARCYLCVQGGIEVQMLLGSASTHVLSGLGGHQGRALRKGDELRIGRSAGPLHDFPVPRDLSFRKTLRITKGPQGNDLRLLCSFPYQVTDDSNRMGLRLSGPTLTPPGGGQMLTEGVPLGAIQVPSSGQPIILFVEQQTTGGYPKVANVISADLPSIGQLRPREEVRFELVDHATAIRLLREQEELLL